MNITWLFDLDDTLISNQHDYDHAKIALVEFLFEAIGHGVPDFQSIVNLQAEIDSKNVKSMGFRMQRFPTSCQQTYEEICKTLNRPAHREHQLRAYEIGMQAFDEERWKAKGMLLGAGETLEFLAEQGDELLLLTKGDLKVQEKKVEVYQLNRYFSDENIFIVPQKNKEIIEKVVGERDKNKVYSVGNSIRSDVEPSLAAGLKMIYVPWETWQWEREHKGIPEHDNLSKVERITDLKDNYKQLTSVK